MNWAVWELRIVGLGLAWLQEYSVFATVFALEAALAAMEAVYLTI
jgi:hypothetical protein